MYFLNPSFAASPLAPPGLKAPASVPLRPSGGPSDDGQVDLLNRGEAPVDVRSVELVQAGARFSVDPVPAGPLAPGATLSLVVHHVPGGAERATLLVRTSVGVAAVALHGEEGSPLDVGAPRHFPVLAPGSTAAMTIQVRNRSASPTTIREAFVVSSSEALHVDLPPSGSVPPGGTVDVRARWSPVGLGRDAATLVLRTDRGTFVTSWSGEAVSAPVPGAKWTAPPRVPPVEHLRLAAPVNAAVDAAGCLDAFEALKPRAGFTMAAEYVVEATGEVSAAWLTDSSLDASDAERCVLGALQGARTEPLPGGPARLVWNHLRSTGFASVPGPDGALVTTGTNDTKPIQAVLDAGRPGFDACVAAARDPIGAVQLTFDLGPDGRPRDVGVAGTSFAVDGVEPCLAAHLRTLQFAAPEPGETIAVRAPFAWR